MLMRLLRGPGTGQPSLLARVLAAAVILGMLLLSAPVVGPPLAAALRWLLSLL
jgi:hypothetical protein